MLLIKKIYSHPIDVTRHVIGQKIHVKSWKFECEMEKNDKNMQF
jgi:hypothetical protein